MTKIFFLAQHFHFCLISALLLFFFVLHLFSLANSFISSSIWDFVWSFPQDLYSPSLAQGSETSEASSVTSCFPWLFFPVVQTLMPSPPNDSRVHHLSHQSSALQSPLAGSRSWLSISCSASSVFKRLLKPFITLLRGWYRLIWDHIAFRALWWHQGCIFISVIII